MRVEQKDMFHCPVGLLNEKDLMDRMPERREEIIGHGIRRREELRLAFRAARTRIGWHPAHTAKVIAISGVVTFILAWLLSYISAFGHWYAAAKDWSVRVPLPLLGEKTIDIGAVVPTSTPLGFAARLPAFGLTESAYAAAGVVGLIIFERLLLAVVNVSSIRKLKGAERELDEEIRMLEEWKKRD